MQYLIFCIFYYAALFKSIQGLTINRTNDNLTMSPEAGCFGCAMHYGKVQVLYFPETNTTRAPAELVTAVLDGFTL